MKPSRFERNYRDTPPPVGGVEREFSNKTKLARTHGKIYLNCDLCMMLYETYACWAKRANRHYCSRACASEGKITQVENACAICGDTFLMIKSNYEHNRKTTCSKECRSLKRSRHMAGWNAKNLLRIQLANSELTGG